VILNNKPKYHLFKNTKYALEGLIHAWKTENSFRLELLAGLIIIPAIIFFDLLLWQKMVLLITAFLIIIVELLNSAVENVVDLVTKDFAPLAKTAKDIGATAVMFSIGLHVICWVVFLFLT
jgi:diacylglycerol kinase (ATP)